MAEGKRWTTTPPDPKPEAEKVPEGEKPAVQASRRARLYDNTKKD